MAKNSSNKNFVKLCAYVALFLSALLFLLGTVLSKIFSPQVIGILDLIAKLSLLVGIAFPAYDYSRGLHKAWKIIYWVALFVYIFGCVFGIISVFK